MISDETFGNILMYGLLIILPLEFFLIKWLKSKGVDINNKAIQIKVGLGFAVIFAVIPLLFTQIPLVIKLIITVIAIVCGLANYYTIDKAQKALRDKFGAGNDEKPE